MTENKKSVIFVIFEFLYPYAKQHRESEAFFT